MITITGMIPVRKGRRIVDIFDLCALLPEKNDDSGIILDNLIIARTFIQSNIPKELHEAAEMDGCGDIKFFLKIVLPLSGAVIAVLVLFYGVANWNSYFNAMLYLNDKDKYSLPIVLKQILISSQIDPSTVTDPELQMQIARIANVIKYSLIVVAMVPIAIIYPFIQKYFEKGVTLGAVKG